MEDRKHSEEGIIGLLVQHPEEFLVISTKISAAHFADPLNCEYFEFFDRLSKEDKTWDEILFLDQFPGISSDRFNKILEMGNYLHLNQYIENVRLKHIARKLFKESTKAQDIDVDKVRELVEDFYQVDNLDEVIKTSDVLDEVIDLLESDKDLIEIPIYLEDLNNRIGGLARKQVYTIAGRPGHSKSMLVTNLVECPLDDGRKVLMVDYEMPAFSIMQRLISIKYNVPLYWHKRKTQFGKALSTDKKYVYKSYVQEMKSNFSDNLQILKHATLAQIRAEIIRFRPDVIIIDTIQALSNSLPTEKGAAESTQLSRLYKSFERMADKYNCNITVCSQVNVRDDSILPSKGHMKGSGGIEESSSVILTVRNQEIMERNKDHATEVIRQGAIAEVKNKYDVAIRKNRHGEEIEREYFYNKATGRVSQGAVTPSIDEDEKSIEEEKKVKF